MLTEEELNFLADIFSERFGDVGAKILQDIAISLKETGDLIPSYSKKLQQLYEYGYDVNLITKELARESGKSIAEIEKLYESVAQEGYGWAKPFYDAKGVAQIPLAENAALQSILQSAAKVTRGNLQNISNTTMLGIGGGQEFQPIASFYKKTVDRAITAAATGAEDYNTVIKNAIKEMGESGLRVQYEKGYTKRLDGAIRQNVLDGVSYIAQETAKATGEEFGTDGVEISAHSPCAPDHIPYQGNQYSTKEFDKLQGELKRPIGQWNCRHMPYPILLGISVPANSKKELAEMQRYSNEKFMIDGKEYTRYECTQIQRKLETAIRYAREEKQLYQAVNDADLVRGATGKIRILSNKYIEVGEKAGLPTRAERMRTVGTPRKEKVKSLVNNQLEEYNKKQEEVRKLIRSDAIPKTLNKGAQNKHIRSSKGYIEGRSYILGDIEEAQRLVKKYSGTGTIKFTQSGEWVKKEFITTESIIGITVDYESGTEMETNRFAIHYGKKGTHIVPMKEVREP